MIKKFEEFYICINDTTNINMFMFCILFLILSCIVTFFIRKNINKIDRLVKKKQKEFIFIPVGISIVLVILYLLSAGAIDSNVLIALLTFITFCFTLLNVYISNYWSEISNHRNATLINIPYIDVVEENGNWVYKNIGETAVKYLKLYENDIPKKEKYYSEFNDGILIEEEKSTCLKKSNFEQLCLTEHISANDPNKTTNTTNNDKIKVKHKIRNTIPASKECVDAVIFSMLKNKFKLDKTYSNILIHTDFSQRNIFIIYTYWHNEDNIEFTKRFVPMIYDINYDILVGQEKIAEVIKELPIKNKDDEVEFINVVIEDYTKRMQC